MENVITIPYDYTELISRWLNNTSPNKECRTAKYSSNIYRLSFKGNKLYSYDSLLAIYDKKTNIILVDSNISNYSITSKKQYSLLLSCVRQLPSQQSPIVYSLHEGFTFNPSIIDHYLLKYKRARVKISKTVFYSQIISSFKTFEFYLDYFKIDKHTKLYRLKQHYFKLLFKEGLL